MSKDSGWHRETRLKVIDFLKESGYQPISSHTGKGEISLYIENKKQAEKLSEPDIVVPRKNNPSKVKYIIEIEDRSPTPKKVLGAISAVKLSKTCIKGGSILNNKNTRLIIVVPNKAIWGEGKVPNKQSKFMKIERMTKEKLLGDSLADLFILSEMEFFDFLSIDEIFE